MGPLLSGLQQIRYNYLGTLRLHFCFMRIKILHFQIYPRYLQPNAGSFQVHQRGSGSTGATFDLKQLEASSCESPEHPTTDPPSANTSFVHLASCRSPRTGETHSMFQQQLFEQQKTITHYQQELKALSTKYNEISQKYWQLQSQVYIHDIQPEIYCISSIWGFNDGTNGVFKKNGDSSWNYRKPNANLPAGAKIHDRVGQ